MSALLKDDRVICAYAEPASGPGWSNMPLWVVVRDKGGNLAERCLQPEEQSAEIIALYRISREVHGAMFRAVRELQLKGKKR
jgi:hypothetical protein